jgi:DNA-binding transcriptional LysR family regulator
MNLNHLDCFVQLARTLSFTKTAEALGVTQPNISRQIKRLEEEIGTPLFIRDRHSVRLTREGERLKLSLTPLLQEIQGNLQLARDSAQQISGTVSFGCLMGIGRYFFSEHLIEFQKRYPDVSFDVLYIDIVDVVDEMKRGRIDFGVTLTPIISENIRCYDLLVETSVMVTRAENPRSLTNVDVADFVAFKPMDPLLGDYLKRFYPQIEMNSVNTANSHEFMLRLLLASDRYAVLPYYIVEKQITDGLLKFASPNVLTNKLYLVHLESEMFPQKNQRFRDFIVRTCRDHEFGPPPISV